jgi:hypothetical protein
MAENEVDPGETPTTTPAGETPAGNQTPDAAELQAELERVRAALKSANSEAAKRRKALDAFEQAEEERKQAEMTELERVQAKLKEAQDRAEAIELEARAAKISHAVTLAATQANFNNPADAMAFLGDVEFEVDDKGKVEGVAEALATLATERPYLVKTAATSDPDARKRNATTERVTMSEQAKINRRFNIRDPHVK